MKKVLLATTVLAAVSVATPVLAEVSVTGYYRFGWSSYSDDSTAADTEDSITSTITDSEINIIFSETTDSGLTYGATFEIEGAADTATGNNVDESSLSLSGDFGKVILGNNDYAHDSFITWAPTHYGAFTTDDQAGVPLRFATLALDPADDEEVAAANAAADGFAADAATFAEQAAFTKAVAYRNSLILDAAVAANTADAADDDIAAAVAAAAAAVKTADAAVNEAAADYAAAVIAAATAAGDNDDRAVGTQLATELYDAYRIDAASLLTDGVAAAAAAAVRTANTAAQAAAAVAAATPADVAAAVAAADGVNAFIITTAADAAAVAGATADDVATAVNAQIANADANVDAAEDDTEAVTAAADAADADNTVAAAITALTTAETTAAAAANALDVAVAENTAAAVGDNDAVDAAADVAAAAGVTGFATDNADAVAAAANAATDAAAAAAARASAAVALRAAVASGNYDEMDAGTSTVKAPYYAGNASYNDSVAKVTYMSPDISGFKFGVSVSDTANESNADLSFGASFSGSTGMMGEMMDDGMMMGGMSYTITANSFDNGEDGDMAESSTAFGVKLGLGDLTITAAQSDGEKGATIDTSAMQFGVGYAVSDALSIGASTSSGEEKSTDQELDVVSLSLQYSIAPGLAATAAWNTYSATDTTVAGAPRSNDATSMVFSIKASF